MGVNRAGFAIVDHEVVTEACRQEVIRYYFRHVCEQAMGVCDEEVVERVKRLMQENEIEENERKTERN